MSTSMDILKRILNEPISNNGNANSDLQSYGDNIPTIIPSVNGKQTDSSTSNKNDDAMVQDSLSTSCSSSSLEIGLTELDEFEQDFLNKINKIDPKLVNNYKAFISLQDNDFKKIERKMQNSQNIICSINSDILRFSENLQKLSKQMNNLDFKSKEINEKLDKYSDLKHELLPIVNDLIINPKIIHSIINDKINSYWCDNLTYLDLKCQFLKNYNHLKDYKFIIEIQNLLDLLIIKSIHRIKNYLINKIKLIRFKEISLQVIQNQLLKVAQIFQFMQIYKPQLVKDFQNAYILTVKWYYYKNFGRYLYSLEKLKYHRINESFLLGNSINNEPNSSGLSSYSGASLLNTSSSWLRSFNSSNLANSNANNSPSVPSVYGNNKFDLSTSQNSISLDEYLNSTDSRLKTLFNDDTCLPAQIAETNPLNFWIEFGFKNFNLCILDNCKVEYYFLKHFLYQERKNKNATMNEDEGNLEDKRANDQVEEEEEKKNFLKSSFQEIFGKVFNLGSNYTKFYLINSSNYDYVSILLSLKFCDLLLLKSLNLPNSLSNYFQFAKLQLWPVFQNLIELNCKNLQQKFLINTTISNSTASSSSSKEMQELLQNPRQITVQFTEVLSSLLKIASINFENEIENLKSNNNTDETNDESVDPKLIEDFFQSENIQDPLSTSIPKLRNEFETILNKISKTIGSPSAKHQQSMSDKRRELFFYVNYNYVYDSLENLPNSKMIDNEKQHFKLLVDAYKQAL